MRYYQLSYAGRIYLYYTKQSDNLARAKINFLFLFFKKIPFQKLPFPQSVFLKKYPKISLTKQRLYGILYLVLNNTPLQLSWQSASMVRMRSTVQARQVAFSKQRSWDVVFLFAVSTDDFQLLLISTTKMINGPCIASLFHTVHYVHLNNHKYQ